jgi:signal transduction histidine kinase
MTSPRRTPASRLGPYFVAIGLSGAAVAARVLLEPAAAGRARFLLPLVIVTFVAAFAGRGPAIAAAIVGAGGTLLMLALLDPGTLGQETIPLALFVLCVVAVVVIAERLRDARAAAEDHAALLAAAVDDRERALERLQVEHRLAERRARILEGTQDLSIATVTPMAPAQAADRILEIAMAVLGAATGAVAVRDEGNPVLAMLAMRGYPDAIAKQFATIPLDADIAMARVAAGGEPLWLESGEKRRQAMPEGVAATLGDVGGAAILPIRAGDRVAGVLALGLPSGRRIVDDDRAFIGLVARKAGQAIERARLTEARRLADLAEQQRAEQLRTVLETMRDGIAVISDGAVLYRNAALDRLAGVEAATIGELGDAFSVTPSDLLAPAPHELEIPGPTGARRWIEASAIPIGPSPAATGVLLVVRDVTGARTAAAVRDAYVGMLSHELRTPITIILGSAGLLERRYPPGEASRELVADIVAESERMSRLIDDLLVLSIADSGPSVHPEPVLLRQLVAEAAAVVEGRYPGVTLLTDVPPGLPPVAGDRTLLVQVVRNLIVNAVKYGGPRVTIRVVSREAGGCVETSVSDDGPGIPEQEREAVFEIFFRSRSTAGHAGGAGIGLFVCRRLVEAMDGRIWAEEAPGGGACVRFSIPAYEPAGGEA